MNIFISWSGQRSKQVAELFSKWIKPVLQPLKPWISTRDLSKGTMFFGEIAKTLSENTIGIVFLTQENKNEPWILFEAGAIYKGLDENRIFTFLIDLEYEDIKPPLSQINHTKFEKTEVFKLLSDINNLLQIDQSLEKEVLVNVFETNWPTLEKKFQEILTTIPIKEIPNKRDDNDILLEVLSTVRSLDNKITTTTPTSRGTFLSNTENNTNDISNTAVLILKKSKGENTQSSNPDLILMELGYKFAELHVEIRGSLENGFKVIVKISSENQYRSFKTSIAATRLFDEIIEERFGVFSTLYSSL